MTTPRAHRSAYSEPVDAADLRQQMKRRGLTGAELARRARVSSATVSHALNGRRLHPAKRRAILTAILSVEPIDGARPYSNDQPIEARRVGNGPRAPSASRLRSGYVFADPSEFTRLARGYSYREIAREARMSPTTVSRLAAGLPVRPSVLRRAAAALSRLQPDPSLAALLQVDDRQLSPAGRDDPAQ